MPVTVPYSEVAANRPFEWARDNGNGTVTLYKPGEIPPPLVIAPGQAYCTRRQFFTALNNVNQYAAFKTAVAQRPLAEQLYWDTSEVIVRNDSSVNTIATAMGFSATQVNNFFATAATLP